MIGRLLRIASRLDAMGHHVIADRIDGTVRMAQERSGWDRMTGNEMDRFWKALRQFIKGARPGGVSPEDIVAIARRETGKTISHERASLILQDQMAKLQRNVDPKVEEVGMMANEFGWGVDQIAEFYDGRYDNDEINALWKQYCRAHPEVKVEILRRNDIAYAKTRETPTITPDGTIGELARGIGHESGDPKINMRTNEDLDDAAIETYRLSLNPIFHNPDGSINIQKLTDVIGGTGHRTIRQLERARKIMENEPTVRPDRERDARDAARDLVSDMAASGMPLGQMVDMMNQANMPGEMSWTDDALWDLFRLHEGGRKTVVPHDRWGTYRQYVDEMARQREMQRTQQVPEDRP